MASVSPQRWSYFSHDLLHHLFQLQSRMHAVQQELQELKSHLDAPSGDRFSADQQALVAKVGTLKLQFKELLAELRRKKAANRSALSDDVSIHFSRHTRILGNCSSLIFHETIN